MIDSGWARIQRAAATCAIVMLAAVVAIAAEPRQGTNAASWPATPAGRHAEAWLRAFDSGNADSLRAFFTAHAVVGAPGTPPLEERIERSRHLREDTGVLRLARVTESRPDLVVALARDGEGGWAQLRFEFEAQAPNRLLGVRVIPGAAPDAAPSGASLDAGALSDSLRRYLANLEAADTFSGVVLVAKDDRVLYEGACGLAERRFGARVRPDTRFNLGSLNKLFTKLAIGQLAEAGKLSLSDPVSKYVSVLAPRIGSRITIDQLVNHRSGLGDIFTDAYANADRSRLRSLADWIPLFRRDTLLFAPGSDERYSNAGYVVLGLVIEAVSGINYYDYVREHVFASAGMKDTDSFEADDPIANVAVGYTRERLDGPGPGAKLRENTFGGPARGSSAGGGYSTARDLMRFLSALRHEKLLGSKYTRWMLGEDEPAGEHNVGGGPAGRNAHANGAAAAGPAPRRGGGMAFAGGAPGIAAEIEMDPESGLVTVILCNQDPPVLRAMSRRVHDWVRRLAPS
jgi:CubicO group peptidase (beta-lactamase class C family)